MLVYAEFGISLPDSPAAQYGYGSPVHGTPQAGDLVFFSSGGAIDHVGIADGQGNAWHASTWTESVTLTDIDLIGNYVGARRLL